MSPFSVCGLYFKKLAGGDWVVGGVGLTGCPFQRLVVASGFPLSGFCCNQLAGDHFRGPAGALRCRLRSSSSVDSRSAAKESPRKCRFPTG